METQLQQIELFEPGEVLTTKRPGWFTLAGKPEGRWTERHYQLDKLPAVIQGLNPGLDSWITQAAFTQANRRAVNLRDVGLLFADLDTYHSEGLRGLTPEEQTSRLLLFCSLEGIPAPSIVLFSGRGLQAKWLLAAALEPVSLFEWNSAQLALVKILEPFSSDLAARDVSRVLRVDRTTNTKSGEVCRVVHVTGGVEGCPARYDFQELRHILCGDGLRLLPRARAKAKPTAQPLAKAFTLRGLNWARLQDLRTLWHNRGGVPEGWRETTLWHEVNFLLLAEPGKVGDLWKEAQALAAQIDPGSTFYRRSDLSTLYRKARETQEGQTVEYRGRTYPRLYTPRNSTLLSLFQITPEEERTLRTIISAQEKYRRKVERRRAQGVAVRRAWEGVKPWEAEGISRSLWYELHPATPK